MKLERRLMRCLISGMLPALLTGLTGCGTNSMKMAPGSRKGVINAAAIAPKSEPAPAEVPEKVGWVLVAEDPPTFFPAGLPREANTDFRHGEWVMAGRQESKWFVPRGGIGGRSEETLREEAISMVTGAEKVAVSLEAGGEFIGKSMWTSLLLAAAMGAGMGGCPTPGIGDALETVWAH